MADNDKTITALAQMLINRERAGNGLAPLEDSGLPKQVQQFLVDERIEQAKSILFLADQVTAPKLTEAEQAELGEQAFRFACEYESREVFEDKDFNFEYYLDIASDIHRKDFIYWSQQLITYAVPFLLQEGAKREREKS